MCRVLEVSASGYYAWRHRAPSARAQDDAELSDEDPHHPPRVPGDLRGAPGARGAGGPGGPRRPQTGGAPHAGRPRAGGQSAPVGATTTRDPAATPVARSVHRAFTVDGPDRLWVADITYIPTGAGFLYLRVVLDAWSRRVIGWAMATHLRTELVLAALDMAWASAGRRGSSIIRITAVSTPPSPTGTVPGVRVRPSMGSVGSLR